MKKFLILIASLAMLTGLVGSAQANTGTLTAGAPAANTATSIGGPPGVKASTASKSRLTKKQVLAGQKRLLKSKKSAAFQKSFKSLMKSGDTAKTSSAAACSWINLGNGYWGCFAYHYTAHGYGVYYVDMWHTSVGYYAEYLYWNVSWPNYYWFYLWAL